MNENLNCVKQIKLLLNWVHNKVEGEDKKILTDRLIHISKMIEDSLKSKDDILYIF